MPKVTPEDFFVDVTGFCPGGLSNFTLSFSSNLDDTERVFGCNDLGQQNVRLWATDDLGNKSYIETFVIVQDYDEFCLNPPPPCDTLPTSANEFFATETKLHLYPNPAASVVMLDYELSAAGEAVWQLFNALGQPVKSERLTGASGGQQVWLTGLPAGLYFYRLTIKNEVVKSGRLIVGGW